jgi:hypothetical protein
MLRTRGKAAGVARRGAAASAALTIASVLLLSACGGNDSTASSTPTLKTSTTTAAPTTTPAPDTPSDRTTPDVASPSPSTVDEAPQPVQTTPSPSQVQLTAKDKSYLAQLKQHGINPSNPDNALAAATYICQAQASGVSPQEIKTYVNAMAGQDPSYDQSKMPLDQLGNAYIQAATQTFCPK